MPLEKIFQKIQVQIGELQATMESFVDETIQPSVLDCENLRQQMNDLLENLAVYKFQKLNKELSPSFNIHARVSEKAPETKPTSETEEKSEQKKFEATAVKEVKQEETLSSKKPRTPLTIGINDKFRFINELFSQNSSEYHIVLEQLTNLNTWHETEIYLNSLKSVYGWKDSAEVVRYFYSLTKKRFD